MIPPDADEPLLVTDDHVINQAHVDSATGGHQTHRHRLWRLAS